MNIRAGFNARQSTVFLKVLDVSNNPLAFCGLGIGHLRTLESKLRILDLRDTNFPTKLEGHWNALMLYYDVGEAPRIIHQVGIQNLRNLRLKKSDKRAKILLI